MVGQNPGMSVSRANSSTPTPLVSPIASKGTTPDPRQVSFRASDATGNATGLDAVTDNKVQAFGSSELTPNTVRFGRSARESAAPSSDEVKLNVLKQELKPLLEEQQKLTEALKNWNDNAIPDMRKGEAEKRLKQLSKQIDPLWQVYVPLRQDIFDTKKATASKEHMGDLLSRYQQVDVASCDDIRALTSPKAQGALDAIDYYSTSRSLESIDNDADAPTLNLTEGMGLVHTRLMANFIDSNKTSAAEALFDDLAQTPNMELTFEQEQLLESYGIVPNGKGELINYGSNEVVTAGDFKDFGQIMEYQKAQLLSIDQTREALRDVSSILSSDNLDSIGQLTSLLGSSRTQQTLATGALATDASVSQALAAEGHYDNNAEGLAQSLQAAKEARAKLESAKADLMVGLAEVEEGIQTAQEKLSVLEDTIDGVKTLSTQEDMVSYIQNTSPAQKTLLESAGISLQIGANGQNSVMVNGQPWQPGSDAVGVALGQVFSRLTTEIDHLSQQADSVKTQIKNVDDQLLNATEAVGDLETRLDSHGKSFTAYQEQVDKMLALRNDPERWNALSPEDQQKVNDFLARSEDKIARGQELQAEGHRELNNLRETIADTKQVLVQAKLRIADVFDSLLQLQQKHQAVGAKVYAIMGQITEADQKASSLIQEADALARKVELAPQPNAEDVGALIEEWQAILKESTAHFNELAESMSANQRIESDRLAHYAAEAKELQEYTQQYLEDSTILSKDQIQSLHERVRDLTYQVAA